MVAALQAPPRLRPAGSRRGPARVVPLRAVPDRAVPDRAVPERAVIVHRQPSPRVTRSQRAAVYWRRRLVAAALGLGVLLTATHAGAALGGSTTTVTPERSPHVVSVVVRPGDTLWSIATRVAPESDPRPVVDALAETLGTSSVEPGETITWAP